jgi:hypothetical protein
VDSTTVLARAVLAWCDRWEGDPSDIEPADLSDLYALACSAIERPAVSPPEGERADTIDRGALLAKIEGMREGAESITDEADRKATSVTLGIVAHTIRTFGEEQVPYE